MRRADTWQAGKLAHTSRLLFSSQLHPAGTSQSAARLTAACRCQRRNLQLPPAFVRPEPLPAHFCLQATSMASDDISEEAVYATTGNPLPHDIEQIAHWLLNENFAAAFESAPPLPLPHRQ